MESIAQRADRYIRLREQENLVAVGSLRVALDEPYPFDAHDHGLLTIQEVIALVERFSICSAWVSHLRSEFGVVEYQIISKFAPTLPSVFFLSHWYHAFSQFPERHKGEIGFSPAPGNLLPMEGAPRDGRSILVVPKVHIQGSGEPAIARWGGWRNKRRARGEAVDPTWNVQSFFYREEQLAGWTTLPRLLPGRLGLNGRFRDGWAPLGLLGEADAVCKEADAYQERAHKIGPVQRAWMNFASRIDQNGEPY